MSNTETSDPWYANWFDTHYYHILYKNRDYGEAAQFMKSLTTALQLPSESHILDLACGRGRHSMFLNRLGYRVTGVDLSENSIAFAKAELPQASSRDTPTDFPELPPVDTSRINFHVHDMTQPMDQTFDAVFNLFTSFGYFDNEEDHLRTIKALAKNLKPGACGVIDFMNVPFVASNLVADNEKTEQGITFKQSRRLENGYIYKEIHFTDEETDYHFTERVKALLIKDFQSYFNAAGLELKDIYGSYKLEDFHPQQSERLIMVVRK
jgi:SAM-dependent methyltransferase